MACRPGTRDCRGSDVVVFHVLDPAELEFPYTDPSAFEDLESGEQLPVVPESFRDDTIDDFLTQLRALIRGVDSSLLDEWEKMRDPTFERKAAPEIRAELGAALEAAKSDVVPLLASAAR